MKIKVVFFGSHGVSIPVLGWLSEHPQIELVCVVSQPDRASGRGKQLKPTAVSKWALDNGISLLCPEIPDEDLTKRLIDSGCDLIFVMAYGHILREHILNLPPLGIYNFHASLLPKYRGASPVETAIACGEEITGVSLMKIVKKMDAGDVLDVERVAISGTDFASDVYAKLACACPSLLGRNIGSIIRGTAQYTRQDDSKATFTRKIVKSDGCIDFSLSAMEIYNRVRGFSEHVGSHGFYRGNSLNICEIFVENAEIKSKNPGEIMHVGGEKIIVSAQVGTMAISKLQRQGGKILKIRDFVNGYGITAGDRFELHASEAVVSTQSFGAKSVK